MVEQVSQDLLPLRGMDSIFSSSSTSFDLGSDDLGDPDGDYTHLVPFELDSTILPNGAESDISFSYLCFSFMLPLLQCSYYSQGAPYGYVCVVARTCICIEN